jgi:hypothetical protein
MGSLPRYLASGDADPVTGQSFTLDGGPEATWGQRLTSGPFRFSHCRPWKRGRRTGRNLSLNRVCSRHSV